MTTPSSSRASPSPFSDVFRWYADPASVVFIRDRGWAYIREPERNPKPDNLGYACAVVDMLHARLTALAGERGRVGRGRLSTEENPIAELRAINWPRLKAGMDKWTTRELYRFRSKSESGRISIAVEKACRSNPPAAWLVDAVQSVGSALESAAIAANRKPIGEPMLPALALRHAVAALQDELDAAATIPTMPVEQEAMSKSSATADELSRVPAMTPDHDAVLCYMDSISGQCRFVTWIAANGPLRNKETVGTVLADLAKWNFVARKRARKGYFILPAGQAKAKDIRAAAQTRR